MNAAEAVQGLERLINANNSDSYVRVKCDALIALLDEHQALGEAAYAAVQASGEDLDGARTWQELFRPLRVPAWWQYAGRCVADAVKNCHDDA